MILRGLRGRFLLIFALTFVPIMIGSIAIVVLASRREHATARAQITRWAKVLADQHSQHVSNTELMLMALARAEPIRNGNPAACVRLVNELMRSFPQYANLGTIELNGRLSCSAQPAGAIDLSGRKYFREAIRRRGFAGGDYQMGMVTHRPGINYGFPVLDDAGRVRRVVYAALDLSWLQEWPERVSLPDGTSLLLVDSSNLIVFRYPEGERWQGRHIVDEPLLRTLSGEARGDVAEAPGVDSVRRLFAYATFPPSEGSAPLRLLVGIPKSEAFALRDRIRTTTTIVLLLSISLALLTAFLMTDRAIIRRVDKIYDATERLAGGDLAARTGINAGRDEIAALARAFDEMADSLQQNHERLVRNEQNNRFLAEASEILNSSLNYERTLRHLAELSVSRFAAWCAIEVCDAEGDRLFRYVYHADPEKRAAVARLDQRYPVDLTDASRATNQVLRNGESVLIRQLDDDSLWRHAHTPEHRQLLKQLGLGSVIIVPLRVTQRAVGTLTLVSAEAEREFDKTDLQIAEELGHRAALAVENAMLYWELERRVHERTAELSAVNRELEAFSYSVSHDLRSPLRSLDGFSQALMEDYEESLDAQGRDYLQRIRAAAQRMAQLIDDLLSLARVTRAQFLRGALDITALAESVITELRQTEPQRAVTAAIQPGMKAEGDPGLVRVVLQNLIGNAWKFTGRAPHARIDVGTTDTAEGPAFFVRDNGAGFDMAYADKLFGAFQRLHGMQEFAGTGIGLATVQRIIHRHGGRIWAEATPERGATFYFTLGNSHGRDDTAG